MRERPKSIVLMKEMARLEAAEAYSVLQLTDAFMKVCCYHEMKLDCNLRSVACGGGEKWFRGGWAQKICLYSLLFVVSIGYNMTRAGHSIHVACTVSTNGK